MMLFTTSYRELSMHHDRIKPVHSYNLIHNEFKMVDFHLRHIYLEYN